MKLRMKNFNVMVSLLKNPILKGGFKKSIYRGESSKKGGLDIFQIKGGQEKKRRVVFLEWGGEAG